MTKRKPRPIWRPGHLEDILLIGLTRYNIRNARLEFERYAYEKRLPPSALDPLEEACELLQTAEDAILEWYEDELIDPTIRIGDPATIIARYLDDEEAS